MEKLLYALTDGKNVFDVKEMTSIEVMTANILEDNKESGLTWEELGSE
jgi:hypothetical protein